MSALKNSLIACKIEKDFIKGLERNLEEKERLYLDSALCESYCEYTNIEEESSTQEQEVVTQPETEESSTSKEKSSTWGLIGSITRKVWNMFSCTGCMTREDFDAEPETPETDIITNTIDDPETKIEEKEVTVISSTNNIEVNFKTNTLSYIDSNQSSIISETVDSVKDELTDIESVKKAQKELYDVCIEILEDEKGKENEAEKKEFTEDCIEILKDPGDKNVIIVENETEKKEFNEDCIKILEDPGDEKAIIVENEAEKKDFNKDCTERLEDPGDEKDLKIKNETLKNEHIIESIEILKDPGDEKDLKVENDTDKNEFNKDCIKILEDPEKKNEMKVENDTDKNEFNKDCIKILEDTEKKNEMKVENDTDKNGFNKDCIKILKDTEKKNEIVMKNETQMKEFNNDCIEILEDPGDEKGLKLENEIVNTSNIDTTIINRPVSSKLKCIISKLYRIDQPDSVQLNDVKEISNIEVEYSRDEDIRDTNTLDTVIDEVILENVPTNISGIDDGGQVMPNLPDRMFSFRDTLLFYKNVK